jgi:copper chaperone
MYTYHYKVTMTCSGCRGAVERALKKVDGIQEMKVSLEDQLVTVTTHLSKEFIFDVISKTGKKTEMVS